MTDFYLKNVSVSLIRDGLVEMIGVQEKVDERSFDLRFVAGIDNLYVEAVSFKVDAWYNGVYQGTQNVSVNVVYASINAGSDSLHAYECAEGAYLAAFKVTGMERTGASNRYKLVVTSSVVLSGGGIVRGESFTVVYDGEGRYLGNDKPFSVDLSKYNG